MTQGIATRVTKAGKVERVAMRTQPAFSIRVEKELAERFRACVVLEAKIHDLDANESRVFRSLLRQYCDRVEEVNASPEAKEAAKVLRRKVR